MTRVPRIWVIDDDRSIRWVLERACAQAREWLGRQRPLRVAVNVFPSQIESLLLEIEEVEPQYRLVVRKKGYLDQLTVQVEGKKEVYDAGADRPDLEEGSQPRTPRLQGRRQ